ncbi:MAG: hypothetical protein NZ108_06250 [Bacteroidia bacterium]|nr:hypothetical protein [Bacteroidia bacterium]
MLIRFGMFGLVFGILFSCQKQSPPPLQPIVNQPILGDTLVNKDVQGTTYSLGNQKIIVTDMNAFFWKENGLVIPLKIEQANVIGNQWTVSSPQTGTMQIRFKGNRLEVIPENKSVIFFEKEKTKPKEKTNQK